MSSPTGAEEEGERQRLDFQEYSPESMRERALDFLQEMEGRRSVRFFSHRPIPGGVLETCLRTAGLAPSGANQQPWHFVVIRDPAVKRSLREAAEAEERRFYEGRAPEQWLDALAPLGTNADKPFLEQAPALIAIFQRSRVADAKGEPVRTYYPKESVGIATGFLIAALHHAGLASLTHTPSPMGFLNVLLKRPADEKAFLLLVVGYPAEDCTVPKITRRAIKEIVTFIGD